METKDWVTEAEHALRQRAQIIDAQRGRARELLREALSYHWSPASTGPDHAQLVRDRWAVEVLLREMDQDDANRPVAIVVRR